MKGLGLRPPHYHDVFKGQHSVQWFEVITENFMDSGGAPLSNLMRTRKDSPVALHGVSLNIGGIDPLRDNYLQRLKALIERIDPMIVSDHLCWTGMNAKNLHDLLPLPMTTEVLGHLVERIDRVQNFLGRRIAFENASTYLKFSIDEMSEAEFLNEILTRADCDLLLDVNNVYVNSVNHHFDPKDIIDAVPADRVVQYHLAGHSQENGFLFDTHDAPVCSEVLELFSYTWNKIGARPYMIERDGEIPEFQVLVDELGEVERRLCSPVLKTSNG